MHFSEKPGTNTGLLSDPQWQSLGGQWAMTPTPLLDALFTGKPKDDCIFIWRLETKRSQWFSKTNIIPHSQIKGNIYFGVGTVSGPVAEAAGNFKRSTIATVSGIGAVWLDVDIAGPAHKKRNLPATADAALALVETAFPDLPPSYIIDSGHGLQLYWLLDSWCSFDTTDRAATAALLLDFNTHWRNVCKAHGLDADSVCDLARVMRLPGTVNNKVPGDPRPVKELSQNPDIRYRLGDLRNYLDTRSSPPEQLQKSKPKPTRDKPKSDVKPDTFDPEKWEALCAADRRVLASWNYDRPDMPDQSPSAYDMSLMQFAVRADWTDAEVLSLVTACRRHHGLEIKLPAMRFTLAKVHAEQNALAGTDLSKAETLKRISASIGLGIQGITRYDSSPPAYVITTTANMKIHLGTIEGITDQKKFRNTVAATSGIMTTKFKGDEWDKGIQHLLNCLDHDSAGAEATEDGQIREWLCAYLNDAQVHAGGDDDENRENGLTAGEPWREAGAVHICGIPFRSWLAVHLGDRVDSRKLGLLLRAVGSEPCTVALRADGETRRRAAWKIDRKVWTPR